MVNSYDIKRGATLIATVTPKGYVEERIMGDSGVFMEFTLSTAINFITGDTTTVDGIEYFLNNEPSWIKKSKNKFQYKLNFQGYKFELNKTAFCFLNSTNDPVEIDFPLMSDANGFVDLIVANMNREHSGWSKGIVDATDYKNLVFKEQNCLHALADLAVEYDTEYWIVGKTIHLTKRENISGLTLEYGRSKGLTELGSTQPRDIKLFTRIIPQGGTRNIPGTYRNGSTRLRLPLGTDYLDRNVVKYGEIEHPKVYDDVYPRRTGIVSSVADHLTFSDNSMDFDVNAQRIPGSDILGKITFNTGQLAGYEFDLVTYDPGTKTFAIAVNKDEKSIELPSALIKAVVGDKFVLTEIIMPDAYILAAELELQTKAQADLNKYSDPWSLYSLVPDPLHFKRESISLILGDYVKLLDGDMGIDKNIRVVAYQKDLQDFFKYANIELATIVAAVDLMRGQVEFERTQKAVKFNRLTDVARARRNFKTTQELAKLLDTLRAEMLLIGSPGAAYSCDLITTITVNQFLSSAGILQHEEYLEHGGIWNVEDFSFDIPENIPYHVYIKASRTSDDAIIVASAVKIGLEEVPGHYHLPFGIISSIIEGTRVFTSTKGWTSIVGNNIQTGSLTGHELEINLDEGFVQGEIRFTAGSTGYNNLADKPVLGTISSVDAISAAMLDDTLIVGGYLKTTLINVSQIIVTGSISTTTDAQNRANAALSSAQTYASAQASAAQAAAISSSSADATTKANAAQAAAIIAAAVDAQSRVSTFSSSLGSMAFETLVSYAKLDSSIIVGGYFKNTLIDTVFLKASVINTSYIQGLTLDFTQGTVGGFTITSASILSDQYYGRLEIGSGATPFIRMNQYVYDPSLGKLSYLGTEITPGGLETNYLNVRYGIITDGSPGANGSFTDASFNNIVVKNGLIVSL